MDGEDRKSCPEPVLLPNCGKGLLNVEDAMAQMEGLLSLLLLVLFGSPNVDGVVAADFVRLSP